MFRGFHDKACADVIEIGLKQLLEERLVRRPIGHHRSYLIVDIATQSMHFENTCKLFSDALELAGPQAALCCWF